MSTIAFCGIGLMGSQMAARLRAAGHSLRVWNRTREKADAWAATGGGISCATPSEAARGADELHLMLADDAAVETALFGSAGALGSLQAGRLIVDHSTVSVAGTAARSARLKTGGWSYLHAPVLAGPPGVAKGEGLMMVAGARDIYDSAAPTLAQILERRWYIGESASDAAAFKLMANSLLLSAAEAMSEFFDIAAASGIERDRAMRLFEHFDPSKTYTLRGSRMANRDYAPAFAASMAAKDARLMIEAAQAGDAVLPSIEATLKRLKRLIDEGHGELDLSALALEKNKA